MQIIERRNRVAENESCHWFKLQKFPIFDRMDNGEEEEKEEEINHRRQEKTYLGR